MTLAMDIVQAINLSLNVVLSVILFSVLVRMNRCVSRFEKTKELITNQMRNIATSLNEGSRRCLTLRSEVQQMQQFLDDVVTHNPVQFLNQLQHHLQRMDDTIRDEFTKKYGTDLE